MPKFFARQTFAGELHFFSGDIEDWPDFYNTFKRTTEPIYTDEENILRLQKCLEGKVQFLLMSPNNLKLRIFLN